MIKSISNSLDVASDLEFYFWMLCHDCLSMKQMTKTDDGGNVDVNYCQIAHAY